jgi:hypothetical protein
MQKRNKAPQAIYIDQKFMFLLQKLSKRGWQLHERVVVLDQHFIHYYRKKPKGFEAGNFTSLSKAKPKMSLKLA